MENVITNPGLQHLAEKILLNLDYEDLENCGKINQSCKNILENPIFWTKKFSKKNQTDWAKAIQSAKNSDKEKHILKYLKWNSKTQKEVDLPCYTDPIVQEKFKKQIRRGVKKRHTEIVKVVAPLTENPNAPNKYGETPIYKAARIGNTEIVKFLALMTDNPNAPDMYGDTPCSVTKSAEIRRFLQSFKKTES